MVFTKKDYLILGILLPILGALLLSPSLRHFGAGEDWKLYSGILSLLLMLWLCFFKKYDLSHIECEDEKKGFVYVGRLLGPCIVIGFTFFLMMTIGNIYTRSFGHPYASEILITKNISGRFKNCPGGTRLFSPHLHATHQHTVCVGHKFAKDFKPINFLKISGKKSFFGYRIDHHEVAEPVEGDFFARLDSANRFWGVFVPCPGSVCTNFRLYENYVPVTPQE